MDKPFGNLGKLQEQICNFCLVYGIFAETTMSEKEKLVSCYRGIFPDVPVSLNTDCTFLESPVTVLIEGAQKHCGQECPPSCEYRQVIESLEAKNIKLKKT